MIKQYDYDFVIIGSGFGGSVSALRLSEKGYKVLVVEQGKWFQKESDFPKTNWNLKKWMWIPKLGMHGLFRLTFYKHVAVMSGAGVGGGSLVYANTLQFPKSAFFNSGSWKDIADWQKELQPFYETAKKMLGVEKHPYMSKSDEIMHTLAEEMGIKEAFDKTDVAVYFGKPEETVSDPYFGGEGPDRTGCRKCSGCMLGCRFNAKNTLDKNYLYFALKLGCEIKAETEVYDVIPFGEDGSGGYTIKFRDSLSTVKKRGSVTTKSIIFAGGVLGTMKLLLKLKKTSLPRLPDSLGKGVRTNSESLIGVTTFDRNSSFSDGIAIGSIISIDENRSVEPVKYPEGAGFWRLFMAPMVNGNSVFYRLLQMIWDIIIHPVANFKAYFVDDWSKRTHILLYMESIDSTLQMKRSRFGFLKTSLEQGIAPTAFNPISQTIAKKVEKLVNGKAMVLINETLLGIPSTAHILGGACMGSDSSTGVIDKNNKVFNYENMMICDGSTISANLGVNPALTILAITERAMNQISNKN